MTKHPFSDKAIEAAAKAICEKHGCKWDMEFSFNSETRDWWIEEAEAAISAAFEHARGEGRVRDGKCYDLPRQEPPNDWAVWTDKMPGFENECFPVIIIKVSQ